MDMRRLWQDIFRNETRHFPAGRMNPSVHSIVPFLPLAVVFIYITSTSLATNVTVPVGHLLPAKPEISNEPEVLRMCAADLKRRGILPANITLKIITMESCNKFSGVENAAYLHYKHNASIYFGPGCNNEILVIGRLAPRWNVPVIAHMSGDDALADRSIYATLASVALTSATEMARATLTFLKMHGYKRVGIIHSKVQEDYSRSSVHALQRLLSENGITITVEVDLDPYSTIEDIIASGKLEELRSNARIIVAELGMSLHTMPHLMQAITRANMKTSDYVYILPWMQHVIEYQPWEAPNVDKMEVRRAFDQCIFITAHGYDRHFLNAFNQKFAQETGILASHFATLAYSALYDALFLYGLALRDAHDETKNDHIYLDGGRVWQKMIDRKFIGATGQVIINHQAVRVPSYAVYHVTNGSLKIVTELEAILLDKKACTQSQDDCAEHVAKEVISSYWADGRMPPDMPVCGYQGRLCDYTRVYAGIIAAIVVMVAIPLAYFIHLKQKERQLYNMTWRVPRDQVHLVDLATDTVSTVKNAKDGSKTSKINSNVTSVSRSMGSSTLGAEAGKPSGAVMQLAKQAVVNGVHVALQRYTQNRNLTFPKEDLKLLKELRLIENENLNKFYGISFNQQSEMIVMWVYCSRGSLEDILFNDELKLGRNFQVSFAKDVVKGLSFLHSTPIGSHGFLCLQNCLVDSNWTVKISNFGTEPIIGDKLIHNEIKPLVQPLHAQESKDGEKDKEKAKEVEHDDPGFDRKLVQQAPEVIREVLQTKCLPRGTQAADIYSLGMVLYQCLYRVEPFHEKNKSSKKLLKMLAMNNDDDQFLRPAFPNAAPEGSNYNLQLLSGLEACWLELPEMRPNIKKIKTILNSNLKSTGKGSLVDQMMKMMEEYTTNLEQLVKDRTVMLEEAQQQADRLLNNMLPRSIADDLKVGKAVMPQMYACATVLFSDIRGFTRISSMSTPFQIVQFLNDMFSGFDAIIATHDAYKVETIGDAYMIVSGVPKENGNNHVQHIADIALKMRKFISNFKLSHMPQELLMVRIGFHSGPVAAGVVGLAAPRYCLFGDTVNMASRMESTGVANKIHISENAHNLLKCFFLQFVCEERGKVEVKGKGECMTYFLEGKKKV